MGVWQHDFSFAMSHVIWKYGQDDDSAPPHAYYSANVSSE